MATTPTRYRGTPPTRFTNILLDPGTDSTERRRNIVRWWFADRAPAFGVAAGLLTSLAQDPPGGWEQSALNLAICTGVGLVVYLLVRRVRPDFVGTNEADVANLATIRSATPDALDHAHRTLWRAMVLGRDLDDPAPGTSPELVEAAQAEISACAREFWELTATAQQASR
ncbi:hypothetical protein SAMN04489860_0560 [Paraoerskovia marina]|uniref:Uncharacterized protein n=1 Tax=Paraoerskovia marina TaxID=545619 RepID=A0A1H1NKK8_9CELL|nr:DUF6611 family protein [Paraoerskovia marina]SDR99581.1 hypothetical protein SAMN04489860_0560 [Paraoerskovia marina]